MDHYVSGDLVVKVRLEDGEDGTLTIRNVGLDMTDEYVVNIVSMIKDIFEVDGQNIRAIIGCHLSRVNEKDFMAAIEEAELAEVNS